MLTQSVKYTNFNGVEKKQELYFHISKTEIMEHLHLRDRLTELEQVFSGEKKELSIDEIKLMLDMIQELIKISYGIRSDDGEFFLKNDEIYDKFKHSAVYDSFLFSLFEDDADKVVKFMVGLIPPDLYAEVAKQQPEAAAILHNPHSNIQVNDPAPTAQPERPMAPDLASMTPEQLQAYANQQVAATQKG